MHFTMVIKFPIFIYLLICVMDSCMDNGFLLVVGFFENVVLVHFFVSLYFPIIFLFVANSIMAGLFFVLTYVAR
jgi:hypothetical protein